MVMAVECEKVIADFGIIRPREESIGMRRRQNVCFDNEILNLANMETKEILKCAVNCLVLFCLLRNRRLFFI